MISFACPACNKQLKVKDELAGKRAKCPGCGKPITIPAASDLAAASSSNKPSPVPASGAPAEERTLPPRPPTPPLNSEAPTIPPGVPALGPAADFNSETVGAGHAAGDDPEHYAFLAPAEQPDEIGRLGGFRVLKVLGAGGMGVVFQAEDPKLKRKLAIKAMLPALAASENAKQRFLREAQSAAAIEHDHIVPILQVGEDRGVPFVAMPFLKGEPLDVRLQREKCLPVPEVLRLGREIAEGLGAAHAAGLVHRDIKPGNIWLEGERGRVKILDFGLARATSDTTNLTQQGAIIGTPAYMAPEQSRAGSVDHRADLFSLGCVLYRLSTGTMAFKGTDTISILAALALDHPEPPHKVNPGVPTALSDLVLQLLAKKPEERPESAKVVAEALQEIEGQTADMTIPPERKAGKGKGGSTARLGATRTQAGPSAKRRPGLPWLVGGGVVGFVVLAAAVVLFWQTPRGQVRIESDDPNVEIVFDKTGPTVKGADKEPIALRAGEHGILIKRGDFTFEADQFVLKKGQTVTLKVEWLPGKVQVVQDGKVIASKEIPVPPKYTNSLGMEFVLVPKGKSWLGGSAGKPGDKEVEIAEDFYLGKYEVTQEEWEKITGKNPSSFQAVAGVPKEDLKQFPVENVSWNNTQLFLAELNKRDKQAGWVYRLPKEAEWEYACRGGPMADKSESAFDFYFDKPTLQLLPDQANFENGKGLKRTCKVGSYSPNRLGLYDMHGNVWEWCDDLFDPKDPQRASQRVYRGSSWANVSGRCRAANRYGSGPSGRLNDVGFRVARVPVGKEPVAPPPPNPPEPVKPVGGLPATFKNSLGMEFVLVPKGKSWLDGGGGKPGDREVEIAHDFYLGKYEVTQEEWEKVMGSNPSQFSLSGLGKAEAKAITEAGLKRFPVEKVSWEDTQLFLAQLNKRDKQDGWVYRLPKEVEWEYACRGGLSTKYATSFDFYFEQPTNQLLPEQANFAQGQVRKRTCKVGTYQPNRLGLYDMHGNVREWCDDAEKGADGVTRRMVRGGGWDEAAAQCRAASRLPKPATGRYKDTGLRVARVPAAKEPVAPPTPPAKKTETSPPTFKNSLGMEFVLVPKGKSWRGGGGKPGDKELEIAQDFYLGKYTVTQEEWQKVTGLNPSHFSRSGNGKEAVRQIPDEELNRFPVEAVSWDDAQDFLKELNKRAKEGGWVYRLPKEAEWEYACRGGPISNKFDSAFDFYFEKPANQLLPDQANFQHDKGLGRTCKVGSYQPNRLGLYDMHGNVWEWRDDGENAPDGTPRLAYRGGSWMNFTWHCRAAHRYADPPTNRSHRMGLRVARVPVGKEPVAPPPPPEKKTETSPPTFKNSVGMEFVLVPKGKSWLGGGGRASRRTH